jgi:prepilin-type N-terminal cleavage/methylation domain-containing protein
MNRARTTSASDERHRPQRSQRRAEAFTLIELVVVLVVIAIIAGVAVVGFRSVIDETQWRSLEATAQQFDRAYRGLMAADQSAGGEDLVAEAIADVGDGVAVAYVADENGVEFVRYGKTVCLAVPGSPSDTVTGRLTRGRCSEDTPPGDTTPTTTVPGTPTTPAPTTTVPTAPSLVITATGGVNSISLSFGELQSAATYTARCWTASMGENNPVTLVGTGSPIVVAGLENFVAHTCRVDTPSSPAPIESNLATATPVAETTPPPQVVIDNHFPPTPDTDAQGGIPPVVVVEEHADCVGSSCFETPPFTTPNSPATGGVWDVTSFYSTHVGTHRLYGVDRDAGIVFTVSDTGTRAGAASTVTFRNAANTAVVNFDQPTGLAYGAHPARTANAATTTFSVLYLTDAGTGTVWMLDVGARRAHQVATGFNAPTGVAWAACMNTSTGAKTVVSGAAQCLYVAGPDGVQRVPLLTSTDAFGSLQPAAVTASAAATVRAPAAVKLFASASMWAGGSTTLTASPYTATSTVSVTGSAPAGSVVIPASSTGSSTIVVFVDAGDHRLKRFSVSDPATVTVVAGSGVAGLTDGFGTAAQFRSPQGIHFHGNWPFVYVADAGNDALRRVNLSTGEVTTIVGPQPNATVVGWGNNGAASASTTFDNGLLSQADYTTNFSAPISITGGIAGRQVTDVSVGYSVACAIAAGVPYCWGANNSWGGQGNGTESNASITPTAVVTTGALNARTATKISAHGYQHVCALLDNATAACWGQRNSGQVGDGTSSGLSGRTVPALVQAAGGATLTGVTDIETGYTSTCAVASGKAYCWGQALSGRLGDGQTSTNRTQARLVGDVDGDGVVDAGSVLEGKTITKISAGDSHACALDTAGAAYCWGSGSSGRLGNGAAVASSVPVAVTMPASVGFTSISAGASHTCAVSTDGVAYCWGDAGSGRLGDGQASTSRTTPVAVRTTAVDASSDLAGPVSHISAGTTSTCAVSQGAALCWGSNTSGQLGIANESGAASAWTPKAVTTSTAIGSRRITKIDSAGAVTYTWLAVAASN